EFEFELRGIAPGAYYVFPLFADSQTANGTPAATYYTTRIPVEVVDRDVTGLQGDIHRYPDVTTRVTLKGNPPVGSQIPIPPRVQLRAQEALWILLTAPGN